jgi:hypothetical protein
MRRSSPSERRIFNLARLSTPVQTLLPGIPSIQKCSSRRSGFYYKPLGFEDVAPLKVVWNLLVPPGGRDCRTVKAKTASPQFTATKALALGKRPDRYSLFSRRKIIGTCGRNNSNYVRTTQRCCQGSVPADRSRNRPQEGPSTARLPAHRTQARTGRSAPQNESDSQHISATSQCRGGIQQEQNPLAFEDCVACWRRD